MTGDLSGASAPRFPTPLEPLLTLYMIKEMNTQNFSSIDMDSFSKAIHTLEFDKIRELLAAVCPTAGAADLARALHPEKDGEKALLLQRETADALKTASMRGSPSFGGIADPSESLKRACKGASLTPVELLAVADVLGTARALLDYRRAPVGGIGNAAEESSSLDVYFTRLMPDKVLERQIRAAIPAPDLIADEASPALSAIRKKMKILNDRIKEKLQSYISGGAYSKYLQENIVTMRDGRYVIPVKVEYKNEIRGLVHDTSASGATLFIEPMAVVEANNSLRELELEEKKEIERILSALSALCADRAEAIARNYENLTFLAFCFGKAELSVRMNGREPRILWGSGKKTLFLPRARHPLLDAKKVVPVDIFLGERLPDGKGGREEKTPAGQAGFDTLVITGPNTGGKTVALKTVGLFALMAQSGLQLPCADGAVCNVFDGVFADIGDEQSIEQSLSTFSAHMKNIVGIEKAMGHGSLVLFDELGAGTDPVEGAALAIAILERTREKGALCAATTHYAELKAYAIDTEGVCNAACEFDVETLSPTYRLIIGAPGKSNAFAISEKLGLPAAVVERARTYVSGENRRFENVIEKLEENRTEMEKQREKTKREREEYERFEREARAELEKTVEAEKKAAEKAREKAEAMLLSAKITSDYVMRQLEDAKKKKSTEELDEAKRNMKKKLAEADAAINPVLKQTNEGYVLPRPLRRGDEVLIVALGRTGYLESDPDKNGNVSVKAGILSTRTNIAGLQLINENVTVTGADGKKKNRGSFTGEAALRFSPELDLRGELGDDAWFLTDRYLDDAVMVKAPSVRIIHGKGTGALRKRLWKEFKNDPRISAFRLGTLGEGDSGVTIVEMKVGKK